MNFVVVVLYFAAEWIPKRMFLKQIPPVTLAVSVCYLGRKLCGATKASRGARSK
jgi:hypothetical protein